MSRLEIALNLAGTGFHVFPLVAGKKIPPRWMRGFPARATRDPDQLEAWFGPDELGIDRDLNLAISTSCYGEHEALLVLDIDRKRGRDGEASLFALEMGEGRVFPPTLEHRTPTGGRHLIYRAASPVKQSAGLLGVGLDVRSKGGFVVAPGSRVDAGSYAVLEDREIAEAPAWLVTWCGTPRSKCPGPELESDTPGAVDDAIRFLERIGEDGPPDEGTRNDTAYWVACCLRDYGVCRSTALELLAFRWDSGGLAAAEFEEVIAHAYTYAVTEPGSARPEKAFAPPEPEPVPTDPISALNRDHALVMLGGSARVMWEAPDAEGVASVRYLKPDDFKTLLKGQTIQQGKGKKELADVWLASPRRRTYQGVVFRPGAGRDVGKFVNTWRGFAIPPAAAGDTPTRRQQRGVDRFLEHTRDGICSGNAALADWLLAWAAEIFTHPGRKPFVAVVLQGGMGTGKTTWADRLGAIVGRQHYLATSKPSDLVGNFTSQLESCILFSLEEVFWPGDKPAEMRLKDVITGATHRIERKHVDPYSVANYTRILIIGNAERIVPASLDERRYTVIRVSDAHKQDRVYFRQMREDLEAGGYPFLHRYLLQYTSSADTNAHVATKALAEQKAENLDLFDSWWMGSLLEGSVLGLDAQDPLEWPSRVRKADLRQACELHAKRKGHRWTLNEYAFGRRLRRACPGAGTTRGADGYAYTLPDLASSRAEWEATFGAEIEWEAGL